MRNSDELTLRTKPDKTTITPLELLPTPLDVLVGGLCQTLLLSTCFPLCKNLVALGPVGGAEAAAGPVGILPCPLSNGLDEEPLGAVGRVVRRWFARLRGPVGGGAPNLDELGPVGGWEEPAWAKELSRARGARGGAFPDIVWDDDGQNVWEEEGR